MGSARDAIARVTTRQDQGFAILPADFEQCIAEVDVLHTLLIGYDKRTQGSELQNALIGYAKTLPQDHDQDEGSGSDDDSTANPIVDKPKAAPLRVAIDQDPIVVVSSPKSPSGRSSSRPARPKSTRVTPHE
jgi:hypothetical protein